MTGVHVLGVELRPLLSFCAALLGALIVALSLLHGDSDSTSTQPALAAAQPVASPVPCAPNEVCRQVVRLGGDGSAAEGGVAGSSTVVRISPAAQSVSAGEDVIIEVLIDDVADLGAYEFKIQYEPSVLSFASVENGPFLESSGRSILCPPLQLDEVLGTLRYGCTTPVVPPPFGPTGSGLLATVSFSTSCAGTSELKLVLVNMTDATITSPDIAIVFTTQDGDAAVNGGAACPTPTVTATATASPSPTSTAITADTPIPGPPTVSPTLTVTPTGTLMPQGTAPPTATWTQAPTWTPVPTWTPEPTWTPDTGPTETDIPVPPDTPALPSMQVGDTNCDGEVTPVDAMLIVQLWTNLLDVLPCPEGADADGNGRNELIDATMILQFSTGIIASLPPS